MKQVRFGKLAFLQQNGAFFGPKKPDFRLFTGGGGVGGSQSILQAQQRGFQAL